MKLDFTVCGRDSETNLDFANARHYASQFGRFMSPDPLGGDVSNPRSLNAYAYVLNSPLSAIDPSGMDGCVLVDGVFNCTVTSGAGGSGGGGPFGGGGGPFAGGASGIGGGSLELCALFGCGFGGGGSSLPGPPSASQVANEQALSQPSQEPQFHYAINRWAWRMDQKIDKFLAPVYKHFQNSLDVLQPCHDPNISCGVVFPTGGIGAAAGASDLAGSLRLSETLPADQLLKLQADIATNGLKDTVIKYTEINGHNYVVFGNNRLQVARRLGITNQLRFERVGLPFKGFHGPVDVVSGWLDTVPDPRDW